jgi:hypothetical protein
MNVIQQARPSLLLSSRRCPTVTSHFTGAKYGRHPRRMFIANATVDYAPSKQMREEIVEAQSHSHPLPENPLSQATKPPSTEDVRTPPEGRLPTFGEKLRTDIVQKRAASKIKPLKDKRDIVSAAGDAISRDHARQGDVLLTLHRTLTNDLQTRKKKRREKKKQVDTSAMFGSLVSPTLPGKGGRNIDEWVKNDWGRDGMGLFPSTIIHHVA